jgi:hypothetical protein
MDTLHKNITIFFEELLTDLQCQQDTKSYIVGIYGKYKTSQFALANESITGLFAEARNKQDFASYQNLGDWLFYSKSMFPNSLKNASQSYYDNIAKLSYYNCYRIIKSWKIYEELADQFTPLSNRVKNILDEKIKINS